MFRLKTRIDRTTGGLSALTDQAFTPRFSASAASFACLRAAITEAADFLITAAYGFSLARARMLVSGLRLMAARRTSFLQEYAVSSALTRALANTELEGFVGRQSNQTDGKPDAPGSPDDLLDLLRLQQTRQVGTRHDGLGQVVVRLELRLLGPGAVQVVQLVEGRLGPDAEATDVTAGSQLLQVQLGDRNQVHAGDVAEGLGETRVLAIDDQRAQLADATAVTHLTLASTEAAGLVHLLPKQIPFQSFLKLSHKILSISSSVL